MLYDECIKQLKFAAVALEDKKYENANEVLKKAQDILMELIMSLDLHFPVAGNLMNIYDFLLRQIVEINVSKDKTRIQPVTELVGSLREAWTEIRKQQAGLQTLED